MKKSIIILGMLGFSLTYAQQDNNGKVGINTENPTEVLDVNGNARIRNLQDGESITIFPYEIVSKQDGTLGKTTRNYLRWTLSDMDLNGTVHQYQDLSSNNITKEGFIAAENTQELIGSDIYISIPNKSNVLNLFSWTVWLHIKPIDINLQRGSFRYYAKYQEIDENNNPIGDINYTSTIFMISFTGLKTIENDEIKSIYRVSGSPTFLDKGTYFTPGKRYRISLTYGLESATNGIDEIRNWGVTAKGESFFENRK